MPHGQPDWGRAAGKDFVHVSQDIAELAVRLGSPVRYHRSGNVLFMDGFEHGLAPWVNQHSAGICDIVLTQETAATGGVCAELQLGVGAGSFCNLTKPVPHVLPGKVGISAAFSFTANMKGYWLVIEGRDGALSWYYAIRYNHVDGLLEYINKAQKWLPLETIPNLVADSKYFHYMKLTVDLVNQEYGYAFFDQATYAIPKVEIYTTSSSNWPYISGTIYAEGNETDISKVYVDDVVITGEEY